MTNRNNVSSNGYITPNSNRHTHETGIQSFSFEGTLNLRTLVINGNPYFVAIDVAKALGYYVPKDAVSAHCRKAVKHRLSDNQGVPHDYNVIPESDVYRLIMRSNLPTAEKFQDWVVDVVLPSIRKTGSYEIEPSNPHHVQSISVDLSPNASLRKFIHAEDNDVAFEITAFDNFITLKPSTVQKMIDALKYLTGETTINNELNRRRENAYNYSM